MRQDKHDTSSTRPSLSLYEITVPVMIAGLGSMSKFLDRGRGHADEKGIAHASLLSARLADDMMTLVQQVQRASDTARLAAGRATSNFRIAAMTGTLPGLPAARSRSLRRDQLQNHHPQRLAQARVPQPDRRTLRVALLTRLPDPGYDSDVARDRGGTDEFESAQTR